MSKRGFFNNSVEDKKDITKKRRFNFKEPEIWEEEKLLLQKHEEDVKEIFFKNELEIDSDTEDFYDFIFKGKTIQI